MILLLFGSGGAGGHALTGSVAVSIQVDASGLAMSHAMSGGVDVVTSVTGDLLVSHPLAGGTDIAVSITGDLTVGHAHPLTGLLSITSAASAAGLSVAHPLTGTTAIITAISGSAMTALHPLTGAVAVSTRATADYFAGTDPTYRVVVVERDGTVVRELVYANVQRISEELNGHGTHITFSIPKFDPPGATGQAADVRASMLKREVQVWEGGSNPVAWGVLVGARAGSSSGEITIDAPGLGWYFAKRFINKPRDNYLLNPDFEAGTANWTATNLTAAAITSPTRLGGGAVRLTNNSEGEDAYLSQSFTITGTEIGTNVYVAAHAYLESFTGAALGERGLYVTAGPTSSGTTEQVQNVPIGTVEGPGMVGAWERLEIPEPIRVPASTEWTITVRLYVGDAVMVVDATQAVIPESIGDHYGDISSSLFRQVIEFAQNVPAGKSDLRIGTDTPPAGVTIPVKAWQFDEQTPAETAIRELVERSDGFDWRIEFTDVARTATTYPAGIGVDRSASLTLSTAVNVATYDWAENGGATENAITVHGDGDGPDREEGYAVDTAALGGLVLQGVYPAPPSTTIDTLAPIAEDHLATTNRLVKELTLHTRPSVDLVRLLSIGDTVAVAVADGYVQASGNWRIVRRDHHPRTETLDLMMAEV